MIFSLTNVPISFQDYVNKILATKFNIFIIIYLNNILIYIENPGQSHINII